MKNFEKQFETAADGYTFKKRHIIYVMVFLMLLGVVGNWIGVIGTVATAPAKVIKETFKTDNILQSYEWFFDMNASYQARVAQVRQYQGFFKAEEDPKEMRVLRMEMASMQQSCRNLVTKYNANSSKMNKRIFKGWSLPDLLSINSCE